MEIFIPGNVPSSKNSRMMTKSGLLIKSPLCFKYEKATKDIFIEKSKEFRATFIYEYGNGQRRWNYNRCSKL